jgi:hypothetical protein
VKSIREFIEGKIRRSESEAVLASAATPRAPDRELGGFEVTLTGPSGSVDFWEKGLVIASGARIAYESIERVEISPAESGRRFVDIVTCDGPAHRLDATDRGGEVVHAALRWIGNTRLKRRIAD